MKPRTAFSPKNGVHGGEHYAPETSTCSRNSKKLKSIRDKKTRRVASKARRKLKCRRLTALSRKAALIRKTRRRKQGKTIAKKFQSHEDSVAQEAVNHDCPPFGDKIETNESNPISAGETFTQSPLRAGGGLENVWGSTVACPGKEPVAEEVTTVIILAEVLWLLEGVCKCTTHFIFTANSVSLKISDDDLDSTIILWPLNEINSFGSYSCEQEGYTLLELGLTDSGAEALKQRLEEMPLLNEHDLLNCKGHCITAKICYFDWPEQKIQILSLSSAYKSLWRPLRMEINAGQVTGSSLMRTNRLWTSKDKESFGEVTEVTISADDLLLSESVHVRSSLFAMTADTISLSISDGCSDFTFIKWPLNEINSIASYMYQQESCVVLELGLTDSGAEALKRTLKETPVHFKDDVSICPGNCLIAKISDVDWTEQQRKIISLSESYKSLWRPLKVEIHAEQDFDSFQGWQSDLVPKTLYREDFDREDLIDSGEEKSNDQEGSDDQAEEGRHEASLHGWFDIVYPKEDPDAVTVTQNDFLLLNPEEFISDTIIDFYIKYLQSTLSEQDKKQFYFFNSFFFRKLTEIDRNLLYKSDIQKSTFERVKRWTTKINIFEKDYLFIPIMESAHWSLIIICNPGYISAECEETITSRVPIILHFDSLEGCHTGLEEPIRNYLMEAWMHGKSCKCEILPCTCNRFSEVKFMSAQVPQQTNYSDCGLFLLHYVELFIREVQARNFTQFVTCEWFDPIEASNKRVDIQNLILRLRAEELDERGVVFGCLDFQDGLAFSQNNGGASANSAFLLQEVIAVGNRDQVSISNDFERINVFHNTPVEQMSEAIFSTPFNCSNQMSMDTFDRHDDSTMGVDLYPSLSLDVLAPSCQFPHDGSYKQLFMLCHSGAKFSLEYAREEDFSVPESLCTNPTSEDLNPVSINISMNENTRSGSACILSNPYHNDMHNTVSVAHQLSIADLEGTFKEMGTREIWRSNTVDDKINQLPVSSMQMGSTIDVGNGNMESSKTYIKKGIENYRSIYKTEIEDSHRPAFQEIAFQGSIPSPINSTLKLTATVCSKEAESKVESFTDINHKEDDSVDKKEDDKVTVYEDIVSIHKDLCALQQEHTSYKIPDSAHDEELSTLQNVLRLDNTNYVSLDVGQFTPNHQAQPGLEVENMLEVVEIEGPSKEDRPTSPQNLSTSVCSNKATSSDEICANRNQKEGISLHNWKEVTSSEDIASIYRDLCVLKEKHIHYENPENRQCVQSDAEQCTDNHQAQTGVEVKNMFEIVRITKPNCRKSIPDSEILESAGRRPITRSATKRNEEKRVRNIPAQQGRKRKSPSEAK